MKSVCPFEIHLPHPHIFPSAEMINQQFPSVEFQYQFLTKSVIVGWSILPHRAIALFRTSGEFRDDPLEESVASINPQPSA